MDDTLNKIKKFLLDFGTFIFMALLMATLIGFSFKKSTEKYFSRDFVKKVVYNIDLNELLKDENGNELKIFTEFKNEFISAGIPVESIDSFISSKPVKEFTGDTIYGMLDYKEGKQIKFNGQYIYNFLENNIDDISNELKETNAPNSEYFTEENQNIILSKMKEKIPTIDNKLNSLAKKMGMDNNYTQVGNFNFFDTIDLIYTDFLDTVFLFLFIISIVGIGLTRFSLYKPLKWIGLSFLITSAILYLMAISTKVANIYITSAKTLENIFKSSFKELFESLREYAIIYFIIAIVLIALNIVISYILNKKEDKIYDNM